MPFEKITDTIFMVGSEELSGTGDAAIYALAVGTDEICMIDAGSSHMDKILANIDETPLKGRKLTHMIITHAHFDHIGAVWQFKAKFPTLKVCGHSWDKDVIEGKPDAVKRSAAQWYGAKLNPVKLDYVFEKDREILKIGNSNLVVIHTPGHTPGDITVLTASGGKKILFANDVHGPFLPDFKSNIQDWAKSMKLLLSLDADILCEGHYGVYPDKNSIKKYVEGLLKQHGFQ